MALAERQNGRIRLDDMHVYQDPDLDSFEAAIGRYFDETGHRPKTALFALAGPIDPNGAIRLTNRAWPRIDPVRLQSRFDFDRARIINDFAAMARGVPEVREDAFEPIIESAFRPSGATLITGPGTGFGISTLHKAGSGWKVHTGEGGHAAFAPRTRRETDILQTIAQEHGYVSNEMIVSGRWLETVYRAICDLNGIEAKSITPGDLLRLAKEGNPTCREVCIFRARAIMGAIGDAALITGARRHIVLTGGVAERMIPWLRDTDAIDRFHNRGLMSPFLAQTPVSVLTAPDAPLLGAAALHLEDENETQ